MGSADTFCSDRPLGSRRLPRIAVILPRATTTRKCRRPIPGIAGSIKPGSVATAHSRAAKSSARAKSSEVRGRRAEAFFSLHPAPARATTAHAGAIHARASLPIEAINPL